MKILKSKTHRYKIVKYTSIKKEYYRVLFKERGLCKFFFQGWGNGNMFKELEEAKRSMGEMIQKDNEEFETEKTIDLI